MTEQARPTEASSAPGQQPVSARASLPESDGVLEQLRSLTEHGVSGTLHVRAGEQQACVRLIIGQVADVELPTTSMSLGQLLVGVGALSRSQLRTATAKTDGDAELAGLLIEQGLVPATTVGFVARSRMATALAELLTWTDAHCQLDERDVLERSVVTADPYELAPTAFPPPPMPLSADAVTRAASLRGPVSLTLQPSTWSVLCALDGTLPVSSIARRCRLGEQQTGLILTELISLGLVAVVEPGNERRATSRITVDLAGDPAAADAQRVAVWRAAARAEARAVATEHARMSAEFEAYEELAWREADDRAEALAAQAAARAAELTMAELAAYAELERRQAELEAYEEIVVREAEAVAAAEAAERKAAEAAAEAEREKAERERERAEAAAAAERLLAEERAKAQREREAAAAELQRMAEQAERERAAAERQRREDAERAEAERKAAEWAAVQAQRRLLIEQQQRLAAAAKITVPGTDT